MNISNKRLGRGLGSLIQGGGSVQPLPAVQNQAPSKAHLDHLTSPITSDSSSQRKVFSGTGSKLVEIPLEHIVPNPHQPRKVIDPQSLGELASSIESEGLLQPIVVRPVENGYELIAGERRWRAHQHLAKKTILTRVLEISDLSSASLSLIENLQREELNPLEEALGYQSLVSDFDLTQQEVAERMGKSRSHITNLLRLLQLDGELRRLLAEGELSVGHAKVLLGIEDPKHRLAIGRKAVGEGWTVRQCEEVISSGLKEFGISLRETPLPSSMYDELAASASIATGRKVKVKSTSSGKGTISLSFRDESDLRDIIEKLGT